jgi:hypothetical protein
MAQVVLTDANRLLLAADPNFQAACLAAIYDQAVYLMGDNGVNKSTPLAAQQWAQWRPLAAQIMGNPAMVSGNGNTATQFSLFISQLGLACWDNVANTTAAAIAWLQSNNYFGANALAQAWFAKQTALSPWN